MITTTTRQRMRSIDPTRRGGSRGREAHCGAPLRERTRRALTRAAREHFSWDGVARTAIAAAEGRLDDLPRIPGQNRSRRGLARV